ncbi:hypothetical protein [Henriciella litoralis]|uniref:hypothetical protein n=1 Tax=Henriciella litoralis TaxID=568102 RepID=UPI00111C5556|nr:hypothetical protein [Henriciella litoralis]
MLDWQTILWCHTRVPVYYWPVLWYWLHRLQDTIEVYKLEGRRFFSWQLERDGRIWVKWCDESDDERAQRGALSPAFDRTPWTRMAPADEGYGPCPARMGVVALQASAPAFMPRAAAPAANALACLRPP